MSHAFAMWSFGLWAFIAALDTIYSGIAFGTTAFNSMVQFSILREAQVDLLFLSFTFPTLNTEWLSSVGDLVTWNQGLFAGWANWIRMFGFLPISMGFVGPLVIVLFSAILMRGRA